MESEAAAIARMRRGDIGGLETLVRLFHHSALKVAYLITHEQAIAEDVVQAAFLRTYERIDRFDAARPFGPWFLRCVANDALAAVTRRRQVTLGDASLADLARLADPTADPAVLLATVETKEALWAGLGQLTPEQRAAIVARYYLDLHGTALARELAVPPGTARRRLHDARGRLRQLLPGWVRQGVGG